MCNKCGIYKDPNRFSLSKEDIKKWFDDFRSPRCEMCGESLSLEGDETLCPACAARLDQEEGNREDSP